MRDYLVEKDVSTSHVQVLIDQAKQREWVPVTAYSSKYCEVSMKKADVIYCESISSKKRFNICIERHRKRCGALLVQDTTTEKSNANKKRAGRM